ncbi:hypothetical protein LTR36_008488 [Oleoguttula mirabilis]|uniref:Uncharacterized protein n=1 Tax=Oleoguttula mirabilis TaxID=1507867 RepID=A0AAV9JTU0_9PEZI|nr:hypothetical protein LTR36_008488 [Oleoguttula mirabilis]
MAFIVDWAKDTAAGYLKTGIQAGGTMAGNVVGGVGNTIADGGRALGEGTVTGGIKGVGGYVNSYGDSIKNSFAADGPVGSAQKTAVKPGQAQRALPSAGGAMKALPSAGGATKALPSAGSATRSLPSAGGLQKALPAPSARTIGVPKPASQVSRPSTGGLPKKPSTPVGGKAADGRLRINPASRPKPPIGTPAGTATKPTGTGARPKPNSNAAIGPKPTAKPTPDGKVRISAASRPKPM